MTYNDPSYEWKGADGEYLDPDSADASWEWGEYAASAWAEEERFTEPDDYNYESDGEDAEEWVESAGESRAHVPELPHPQCAWCQRPVGEESFTLTDGRTVCGPACPDRPGLSRNRLEKLVHYDVAHVSKKDRPSVLREDADRRRKSPNSPESHKDDGKPPRAGEPWTDMEESTAASQWLAGARAGAIADSLGRSEHAVRQRLVRIGLVERTVDTYAPPPIFNSSGGDRRGDVWADAEDVALLAAMFGSTSIPELGDNSGRTEQQIRVRLVRLISKRQDIESPEASAPSPQTPVRHGSEWGDEESAAVVQAWLQGDPIDDIAHRVERTDWAIRRRLVEREVVAQIEDTYLSPPVSDPDSGA